MQFLGKAVLGHLAHPANVQRELSENVSSDCKADMFVSLENVYTSVRDEVRQSIIAEILVWRY